MKSKIEFTLLNYKSVKRTVSALLVFCFGFTFHLYAGNSNKVVSNRNTLTEILVNTSDSTIKLNGVVLKSYEIKSIESIIGKPDRIKTHTFKSYYEEFGYDNNPPTSIPITVTDYYYIYDKLGIMFYTNNGRFTSKEAVCFSVHFINKRTFTNTKALPYSPLNPFKGVLKINGNTVSAIEKIVPPDVNYNTNEFKLFDMLFGPTSIATVIDSLYSVKCIPNIFLYLDNEKDQRISYVVL